MVLCVCWLFCGLCVHVVLCVVVCGEAWLSLSLLLSLLPLLFPFRFPFLFLSYLSFSLFFFFCFFLAPSLTLALALVLSLFLLYSLLATKHYGKNRSTNTAANIEAFECDLAQGKCTAVGSLPPPLPSLLPPPSLPHPEKRKETFYYRNISGDDYFFTTVLNKFQKIAAGENYSHYSFILIPKQKGCNCNHFVKDGISVGGQRFKRVVAQASSDSQRTQL